MAGGVESLGPFLVLQVTVAVMVTVGTAVAIWRAVVVAGRQRQSPPPIRPGDPVDWVVIDGPVSRVLDELAGIYRVLCEIRTEAKANGEAQLTVLRQIERHTEKAAEARRPRP